MKISTTASEVVFAVSDDEGNSVLNYSYSDFNLNVDAGLLVRAVVALVQQIEADPAKIETLVSNLANRAA